MQQKLTGVNDKRAVRGITLPTL